MLESQELADSWREIESLRSDLESRLREAEKFLQSMLRRPADLEPKVSQNQLDQAQVSNRVEGLVHANASQNILCIDTFGKRDLLVLLDLL